MANNGFEGGPSSYEPKARVRANRISWVR